VLRTAYEYLKTRSLRKWFYLGSHAESNGHEACWNGRPNQDSDRVDGERRNTAGPALVPVNVPRSHHPRVKIRES
jgi:hypothetical protein